jgi:hypothetical protein
MTESERMPNAKQVKYYFHFAKMRPTYSLALGARVKGSSGVKGRLKDANMRTLGPKEGRTKMAAEESGGLHFATKAGVAYAIISAISWASNYPIDRLTTALLSALVVGLVSDLISFCLFVYEQKMAQRVAQSTIRLPP